MRATLKQALQGLGLAAIVTTSAPSIANSPRWFDIEVIVFKRNVTVESTQEYWPQPQTLDINTSEPLLGPLFACNTEPCIRPRFEQLPVTIDGRGWPISGATQRQMLSASQLELGEQFAKLNQHAAFTPLIHLAWREIVAPRHRAKFYQLQAGQDFSQRFRADGQLIELTTPETIVNDEPSQANSFKDSSLFESPAEPTPQALLEVSPPPSDIWELEGGIRVYLQHYLYIESQLLLKRPVQVESQVKAAEPPAAVAPIEPASEQQVLVLNAEQSPLESGSLIAEYQTQEQLYSFKFDQKRRVRSGEIHYFDHPLMGMLIQIRRSPETLAEQSLRSPAEPTTQTVVSTTESADEGAVETDATGGESLSETITEPTAVSAAPTTGSSDS